MKYKLYKTYNPTDIYILYIDGKRAGSFTSYLIKIRERIISGAYVDITNIPPHLKLFFEFDTLEEFENKFMEYLV